MSDEDKEQPPSEPKISITIDPNLTVNEADAELQRLRHDLELNKLKQKKKFKKKNNIINSIVKDVDNIDLGENTANKISRAYNKRIDKGLPFPFNKRQMLEVITPEEGDGTVKEARAQLEASAQELIAIMIERAKAGSQRALEFCLVRLLPPVKSAPVALNFKELKTRKDAADAIQQAGEAMLRGEISPTDAKEVIWALTIIQNNLANPATINGSAANLVKIEYLNPPATENDDDDDK